MLENFKPSDLPIKNNEVKEDPFKMPDIKGLPPLERPEGYPEREILERPGGRTIKDIGTIPDVRNLPPLETIGGDKIKEYIKAETNQENRDLLIFYHLPTDGTWDGEKGNSTWYPDRDTKPKRWPRDVEMEDRPTWGDILDKYGIEGIPFNDGEPDFSEITVAEVKVDDFTTERRKNFSQADEKLAEQWSAEQKDGKEWTARDVAEWRDKNDYTWHECSDMKTMQLVPREVHNNVPHAGGISEAKKQERVNQE